MNTEEIKRQELLDAIAANETPNENIQTMKRKATLRPSHLVKAENRAKNRLARKSRKTNRLGKNKAVPKPVKTHGTYISLRPQRHIESESAKNRSQKEAARHDGLVEKRIGKMNLAEASRRRAGLRAMGEFQSSLNPPAHYTPPAISEIPEQVPHRGEDERDY